MHDCQSIYIKLFSSQYQSMRPSIASSSETEQADHRSCQKPRQSRREGALKASLVKKNDKTKYGKNNLEQDERLTNRITNYFDSTSRPRALEEIFDQNNEKENKATLMQIKLSERDEEIKKIKVNNETLKTKVIESRQEIKKRQQIIAKSLLCISDLRRQEKRKIDKELGYFTDNYRKFVEGSAITTLKEKIKDLERSLAENEEKKKKSNSNVNDYASLLGAYQYLSKEMNETKKELENRDKEVIEYRQRLRLAEKEDKCLFLTQKWPIIYEKYQTLELLGSGGFGQVYKCYDLSNNRTVAVKRMKFDPAINVKHFEEFCRHVRREIDIQIKLDHPNIAKLQKVLEVDEDKRCIVFELQYCMGPELSSYMKKHRILEQKQAKLYIKQILCALNYLYNLKDKVIHYDLKPGNIIFHEGVIKILDFGLCKTIDGNNEETKIDLTSQGVGTYWYLPPETFEPYDPRISSKVDVWSVGVIFYEMLYGKRPFGHGLSQNQIYEKGVILKATKVDFPADPSKKHKVSDAAKDFICACLKYEPDERLNPTEAYEHPYMNFKK